jgi:pantetheine-phosphate adenylyltransferase
MEGEISVTVLYPGTFDPITCGHLDIVRRASEIFSELVVAISSGSSKDLLFSLGERVQLVSQSLVEAGQTGVRVTSFDSLLIDFMKTTGARIFVRGLRANTDFEYEFQMHLANRKMAPDISGIYLMPSESNIYLSSTLVKEIASFGGCLSTFVTPSVEEALRRKFQDNSLIRGE